MQTAVIIYLLLLLSGAISIGVGVYLLFGLGWMFIALSAISFGFAAFLKRGLVIENIPTSSE